MLDAIEDGGGDEGADWMEAEDWADGRVVFEWKGVVCDFVAGICITWDLEAIASMSNTRTSSA